MRMRALCGGMGFLVWECAPRWMVKERLVIALRWLHVTVSVSLTPLSRCFSSKSLHAVEVHAVVPLSHIAFQFQIAAVDLLEDSV